MKGCIVKSCRVKTGQNKSLFSLPKDRKMQEIWLKALRREDIKNVTQNTVVCEDHFPSGSFLYEYKTQMLQRKPRRRLRPDAVPCLEGKHLPSITDTRPIVQEESAIDQICFSNVEPSFIIDVDPSIVKVENDVDDFDLSIVKVEDDFDPKVECSIEAESNYEEMYNHELVFGSEPTEVCDLEMHIENDDSRQLQNDYIMLGSNPTPSPPSPPTTSTILNRVGRRPCSTRTKSVNTADLIKRRTVGCQVDMLDIDDAKKDFYDQSGCTNTKRQRTREKVVFLWSSHSNVSND